METAVAAILKIVAEYGALGLGWVAWLLTLWYYKTERDRYQALVIHIVQYFTKVNMSERNLPDAAPPSPPALPAPHAESLNRLFGAAFGTGFESQIRPARTHGRSRGKSRTRTRRDYSETDDEDEDEVDG